MVFSSLYFTFFFLPLVVIAYYLAKEKYRNYLLLVVSLYFYAYGEPQFVFVMIGSIILNYFLALAIDCVKTKNRNRLARNILILDILANLGILFIYKYLDFAISTLDKCFGTSIELRNIVLPIGISFFTFQALSYVIDVYRGSVNVQKNPLYLALYISFFPQLIAGPIVRYSTIEEQIVTRSCDFNKFAEGTKRFMLGYAKKVILANHLSVVATEICGLDYSVANPLLLWTGAICYSLQIFYDFSGYSDMAIGLGKIFGFEFEENFDYPYMAKSVTEFWRRWHISLGQWFRDYVYIPLGGSRTNTARHIFNMFIVWILTGIWHGASYTYIVWGGWYFVLLVIEKYIIKPEKRTSIFMRVLWQIITLVCVNFGWVIFNAAGIWNGLSYCAGMIGYYQQKLVLDASLIRYFREYGVFMMLGILFSTPIMKTLSEKMQVSRFAVVFEVVEAIIYALIFLWAVSYILLGAHNPFIYFNF